jgi:hypothetical protein
MAESVSNKISKGESDRQVEKSPSKQAQWVAVSGLYANVSFSQRTAAPAPRRADSILRLQRTIGNRAVHRLLQTNGEEFKARSNSTISSHSVHDFSQIPLHAIPPLKIQAKLMVNTPGDIYEQEADRISDRVMHMSEPQLERAGEGHSRYQTKQLRQEHERLRTKPTSSANSGQTEAPPIVHEVLNSPGQQLDSMTRAFMEPRFGRDFGGVRVHTDGRAAESARAVNARAYTVGRDVVFADRYYAPRTRQGQNLLAHELAHVTQQSRSSESNLIQRGESEAAAIGKELERPELKAWRASLEKKGYTVYTQHQFDKVEWLKNAIPGKRPRPDMVAINPKTGKIIVGDVTAGPWSPTELKPGDVRKLPHDIGGGVEKKLHIEKTIDRAKQISRHLPDDLKHCEVVAQDRWWQKGGHSRQITVRKGTPVSGGKAPVGGLAPLKPISAAPIDMPKASQSKAPLSAKVRPAPTPPAAAKAAPPVPKPPAKLPAAAKIGTPQVKTTPKHAPKPRPGLGSVAKWGKVSPFDAAMLYLDLHAPHFAALSNVKQRAAIANDLLSRVEGLERGARELRKAVDALRVAEHELPNYPLQTYEETGEMTVSAAELAYVKEYGQAASRIANDAMAARSELHKAIEGWESALAQAEKTSDFTRKSAMEAVIQLDLSFSKEGANFRAYLVNARDDASRVESWARMKQHHASDILGKWTPEWYKAPTPEP